MNNYNFDNQNSYYPDMSTIFNERVSYMPNIDPNMMQFMNGNNMIDMNIMGNMNSSTGMGNKVLEPYQGFIRGNMYADLYDQYKNYKPKNINSSNERENILMQWQQYNFALTDLALYLDVNPNDSNKLNLYKQYLKIANGLKEQYEKKYGPVTCESDVILNSNSWNYLDSPWPWEVK